MPRAHQGNEQAEGGEGGGEPEQLVRRERRKGQRQGPLRPAAQYRDRASLDHDQTNAERIEPVIGRRSQLEPLLRHTRHERQADKPMRTTADTTSHLRRATGNRTVFIPKSYPDAQGAGDAAAGSAAMTVPSAGVPPRACERAQEGCFADAGGRSG